MERILAKSRLARAVANLGFGLLSLPQTALAQAPDLIIDDIWTDPASPVQGQSAIIYARVKNQGNANANAFNIQYKVNGSSIGTDRLTFGLNTGNTNVESISYTFSLLQTPTVCVVADSSSEVAESSESNNERCEGIPVEPPPGGDLNVTVRNVSGCSSGATVGGATFKRYTTATEHRQ